MTPQINAETAALAIGLIALTFRISSPLFHAKRTMLLVQLGSSAGFAIQYALLGASTGAAVCALGAMQGILVLIFGEGRRSLGLLPLVMLAPLTVATWSGLTSALAFSACSLVMLGRLQKSTIALRLMQLSSVPLVVWHDVLMEAHTALAAAAVGLLTALIGLRADLKRNGYWFNGFGGAAPQAV